MKKIIVIAFGLAALLSGCVNTKEQKVDPALVPEVTNIQLAENSRAGDVLTITGKKLNLVKEVRFGARTLVAAEDFVLQTAAKIEVYVPDAAPNGEVFVIAKADVVPNILAGTIALRLPTATSVDPMRVNIGSTVSITGTDLDLTAGVKIGNASLTNVTVVSDTEVTAVCPSGVTAGFLKIVAKSGEETTFAEPIAITAVPAITMVTDGYLRGEITIVGTNMNTVTKVELDPSIAITTFIAQTETNLTLAVPATATIGAVTLKVFAQDAPEGVESPSFTISKAQPTITSVSSGFVGGNVTILGTLLDYVTKVTFQTSKDATIFVEHTATKIVVAVPEGAATGSVTLTVTTADGVTATSPSFTIEAGFDPTPYVYFDFDGKGSWWGDYSGGEMGADANSIDGGYFEVDMTHDGGWVGLFWRNGGSGMNVTGVEVASWGVTMQINVLAAGPGMSLKLRLGQQWGIFTIDDYVGLGWKRIYVPLAGFRDNDGNGSLMTQGELDAMASGGDFGMAMGTVAGVAHFRVDNIGFAPMPSSGVRRK